MIALRTDGTTRVVLAVGPLAFKIARGAAGRRCNLFEARCYRTELEANRRLLCPVLACMKSGRILIMRAARPLTQEEQRDLLRREAFPEWEYVPHTEGAPFEYKASDWGWLGNRLVALDYSSHALFSNEEKQALFEEALRRQEAEDKPSRPEL